MFSGKHRFLRITRLETSFLAILLIFGGLLAISKYLELSGLVDGSMEQGVITAVRQGIAAYAAESRKRGSASLYPPALDEAGIGPATPQNLFFSNVLQRGIAVGGWSKTGGYEYRAPSGGLFVYDPATGKFEANEGMEALAMDQPSRTRQRDAGER